MPKLHKSTYVDEQSCVIGKVTLAKDVSVWPMATLRGDVNSITVGARSNIQDGSTLHVTHANKTFPNGFALTIGDDVTVGHNVVLHGCTIGNRVLVGMGAIVLDGAVVEDDVFIGAGSLVTPNSLLKSGFLYVGSPAKAKRELNENEKNFLSYSAMHYVKLKNDYLE